MSDDDVSGKPLSAVFMILMAVIAVVIAVIVVLAAGAAIGVAIGAANYARAFRANVRLERPATS